MFSMPLYLVLPFKHKISIKKVAIETAPKEAVKTLDERIINFEKLRGLAANQREKLLATLTELTKFKYNNGDSCIFLIQDEDSKEFKTNNIMKTKKIILGKNLKASQKFGNSLVAGAICLDILTQENLKKFTYGFSYF
jgi:hypothetical protein